MNLQQANEYSKKLFSTQWVKWVHEGSKPANTSAEKNAHAISIDNKHCATCKNLNGFYFAAGKYPEIPLHPKCHCYTVNIPQPELKTECPIEKFTKYVFVPSLISDKKQLFELLGYDIMDSEYLQQEFITQARLAYLVGDYELGLLNEYGQRINVVITLKRKDKNEHVTFRSGWMVYPNGKIILTTPFGRK